jgi:D-arabinose 1-dehydrogenase-like Zn-dependent alcohol dehydrogenase
MKAMVLKGPKTLFELTDVPDPVAGPGEAVARVIACGSGLTIQHIKAGRIAAKFPAIIGHEITGEIVAVGAGVTGLAVGAGVTLTTISTAVIAAGAWPPAARSWRRSTSSPAVKSGRWSAASVR